MLRSARSTSLRSNTGVQVLERRPREGNAAWMQRAYADTPDLQGDDHTLLALWGATDTASFRMRAAQSHLRPDLLPSYWSHAMLVDRGGGGLGRATVIEVPLAQPGGREFPPRSNGIQVRSLSHYDDTSDFANCALLAFPIPIASVIEQIERLKKQRAILDCLEHVVRWNAFAWGVAGSANPLTDGYGLPCAAMLEVAFSAAGLDLTPGLESRASCPEAIWTAARWWQTYYKERRQQAPSGVYHIGHELKIEEPADVALTTRAPARRRR